MMRVHTDRIDQYCVDVDEPVYSNTLFTNKALMRRYLVIGCILYMGLYMTITCIGVFDTHQLIPPTASEARVVCKTTTLQTEEGIRAAKLVYAKSDVDVNLYATSITRTATCTDVNGESYTLQYKDDYLNISTVDVDHVYRELTTQYPLGDTYTAFYYPKHCHTMPQELDRNCLTSQPIDPELHYNKSLYQLIVIMQHITVFFIVILCIWIDFVLRSDPRIATTGRLFCCGSKKAATF